MPPLTTTWCSGFDMQQETSKPLGEWREFGLYFTLVEMTLIGRLGRGVTFTTQTRGRGLAVGRHIRVLARTKTRAACIGGGVRRGVSGTFVPFSISIFVPCHFWVDGH